MNSTSIAVGSTPIFILSIGILALASLGLFWGLGVLVTKSARKGPDIVARMITCIGFLLIAYLGLRGATSPVRSVSGAIGYTIVFVTSVWIALQMRKRASDGKRA